MPTRRLPALALLVAACGTLAAADVVIMPDGFVLTGKHSKERELVPAGNGQGLVVDKANGFDLIEDGARSVVFSRHVEKGGKIEKDAPQPEYTPLKQPLAGRSGRGKSIAALNPKVGPFNDKWVQVITGTSPPSPDLPNGAPVRIARQIVRMDPRLISMDSYSHQWKPQYQTSEWPPAEVRSLLAKHPDLKDPKGKADPARRVQIAAFLKDVSLTDPSGNGAAYLLAARQELDKLRADVPGELPKEVAERAEKLANELLVAETRRVCDELEAAVTAGRWGFAQAAVNGFTPAASDPKEALRFATAKATVAAARQRFEQTARLLDEVLTAVAGPAGLGPLGGSLAAAAPLAKLPATTRELVFAASAVRAELHPDTAARLELFVSQADNRRRFGGANAAKPENLLALAVSGGLKGKNGADPDPAAAAKCWAARLMVTDYLRRDVGNTRRAVLDAYRAGSPATNDELAQVVTLLAPPEPLDPSSPGTPVPPGQAEGGRGIVGRTTPPSAESVRGFPYLLRLPAEFHPGRAYPVLLALTDPGFPAEKLVGRLQEYADRFGYVVVAPQWNSQFDRREYDYRGLDHPAATVVLRDVFRRVRCDPDKVFLYGYGGGADFALDLGLAHPDLFAGVVANGAVPPLWLGVNYWRNAQKLPMYFVCGELGGEFKALRPLFEKWMPYGFPALATVYRGRGSPDFFAAELPRVFDWMGRKTRVRGTGSLRLGPGGVEPWQVVREADDRFYWVGVGSGGLRRENLLVNKPAGSPVEPARFRADIGRNGTVVIDGVIGVRKFVVWLERDLIDWSKPLAVTVNGKPPPGFKPRLLEPDLHLMLEELYRTGDTKMLYLGKLEVDGPG